jgi:hypothetical protein
VRNIILSLVLCLGATVVSAQTISSTVKGTVHDPSGAVVPGAVCTLIHADTSAVLKVLTAPDGAFQFLDVLSGTYALKVSAPGFKTYELKDLALTASEFHTVGNLVLEVGQVSDSIVAVETATPVQLASGERSDVVSGSELNDIAVKGRDFVSYLSSLAGIVDTSSTSRDAFQRNALGGIHINGGRDTQAVLVLDGMPIIDAGNNGASQEPNMDAIAEVKVLTSNYGAEYGRNGGGTVTVVSKTGTRNLHGSAYDYYRHEGLNANNFFNNATKTPRAPYRYRMTGWSLGGPVVLPWRKDLLHDKLFFFFSQELVGSQVSYAPKFVTTPSALERQGNYTQSYNVNGSLISIRDPLTGKSFPGNIIPQNRFDSTGQAILNFYPLPNYTDPNPNNKFRYNYRSLYSGSWPRRQQMGRMDANVTPTLQMFFRVMDDFSALNSPWGNWVNGNINYDLTPIVWDRPARAYTLHATKTISPSLVNEAMLGKSFNGVFINPLDPSLVDRSRIGNPPQLFPDKTGMANWLPGISFGGTPSNTINSSLAAQLPEALPDDAYMATESLSKIWRKHQLKAGLYVERNRKIQPAAVSYRGSYSFAADGNNPNNTGDGFSQALLGQFDSYSEATNWPIGKYLFWSAEWYVQDNWRVSSRLTLDFGLRFYHIPPTEDLNHTVATLDPQYFDPNAKPVLYRPAFDSTGARVAQNPLTGSFAAPVLIGLFVPGVGLPADGAKVAGIGGYPGGLYRTPAVGYGPRFGFAYDLFGNGKTALRGGFGMFKDRVQGNLIYNASANPPVTNAPTIYYGNFGLISQGAGLTGANSSATLYGPSSITEIFGMQPMPTVMNFSLGIQHQFHSTTLDVSYVGSLSRHLPMDVNINPIPMFARFNPANFDPTKTNSPLPDNFLRPYTGYAAINAEEFAGTSNYNSLQVSARRRMSHGLQFSSSFTFSKALGEASGDGDGMSSYYSPRFRNYGPLSFNRSRALSFQYLYEFPRLGTRLGWRPARVALDRWQLSGTTTFQTGSPFTPGFTTTNSQDISGSSDSARIDVIGDPRANVPAGLYFNPAAFALPVKPSLGNAGANILYGPGINNWDLSMTKRFALHGERRALQFRAETFNAWNHTQFSGLYTSFSFQPNGVQIDPSLGTPSSARPPRNIQFSARLTF